MGQKYLLLLDPPPQRTLYVSASFINASPMFQTIQAAIDSAPSDGTRTLVLIYPGTYPENLTWKRGVMLSGVGDRNSVVIAGANNSTPIVSVTINDTTNLIELFLRNLTISNLNIGFSGLKFDVTTGGSNTLFVRLSDVIIDCDGVAFEVVNGTSIPTHDAIIERCRFRGRNSASGNPFKTTNLKNTWIFEDCQFKGPGTGAPILYTANLGSSVTVEFRRCVIENPTSIQSSLVHTIYFHGCHFASSFGVYQTTDDGTSHLMYFRGCTIKGSSRFIENQLGNNLYHLWNCTGELGTSSGTVLLCSGGSPKLWLYDCSLQNRIANATGGNPEVIVSNTTVRNIAGVTVLDGTVPYSVLAINLIASSGYNAGVVTFRPASVGNQFNVNDLNGGW